MKPAPREENDKMDEELLLLNGVRRRLQVSESDLRESTFQDTNLSDAAFRNIKLASATIENADLTGACVSDANLSGVRLSNVNLTGAAITDCLTDQMTINGIAVNDLLAAYRASLHPPK
jgi:uncharacterized protein YjbI with pentapeptide repeats